jgi:hypothetical protein
MRACFDRAVSTAILIEAKRVEKRRPRPAPTFSKKNPPLATGPSQGGNARQGKSIRGGVMCRNSHTERETLGTPAAR